MICEKDLECLRTEVKKRVSEKRFRHILGVESAAAFIGEFLIPEKIAELRAAALLHDVTKELSAYEHIKLAAENGLILTDEEISAPQILHSLTAEFVIERDFSRFASDDILSAVRKHTLGGEDMSIFDEIIFISDFVEAGREYESCIKTREFLYGNLGCDGIRRNETALHKACLMSIDYTLENLRRRSAFIHPQILKAKNTLLSLI